MSKFTYPELEQILSAQKKERKNNPALMKPYSGRMYEDGEGDGPADWMDAWTIFYWGWWIAFSPFVGMFIAKISRGRTIRQFINGM